MGMPNDYVITSPDGVEVTIPHGSTNTLYRGVAVFGSGVTGYAKSKEGDKNYWGFIVDMAKMTIDTMKDKANSTQVLTDVPLNAVFTDTIYTKPTSEAIAYIVGLQGELDKKLEQHQDISGKVDKVVGKSLVTDTVLATLISDTNNLLTLVGSNDGTLDTIQEVVDFIKLNKSTLDALSIESIAGLQNALDNKVDNSRVLTDVPLNAVFTDTETITSFQKVGNELKYTNEAGSVTTIDLSLYIDDTNLSRIINGNVDGQGIATFIREDSSSFAIDFSAFFDNTNITDADISNMGYTKVTHGTASDFVQAIM